MVVVSGLTGQQVERVVLMAPASVTHAFDANQRLIELQIMSRGANFVNVATPSFNVMPKGYYLMYVLRATGDANRPRVPSVGKWTKVL
jgi:hypothetical protein